MWKYIEKLFNIYNKIREFLYKKRLTKDISRDNIIMKSISNKEKYNLKKVRTSKGEENMNLLEMNPHETKYIPLIGSPIGGSTASFLYNKIFASFGVNAMSYPVEVKKGELPEFLSAMKYMNAPGFIATSPHKQDLTAFMDEIDDASRIFRSVNAVHVDKNGRMEGHGLDGKGVIGAFDDNKVDLKGKEVLMLGAGGISGIFASELARRGIRKLTILNRTEEKARYVADTLASCTEVVTASGAYTAENARKAAKTADILIQATTLGMKGSGHDHPDLSFMEALPGHAWVMEAVSNPPETAVIQKAKELNLNTVMGMEMLVNQVKAICRFILGWEAPQEAKQIGIDFYCDLFHYRR